MSSVLAIVVTTMVSARVTLVATRLGTYARGESEIHSRLVVWLAAELASFGIRGLNARNTVKRLTEVFNVSTTNRRMRIPVTVMT